MLKERKITITDKCMLGEKEIANFFAVVNVEKSDIAFGDRQIDKEACMENRELVRADRAEFEDFAYSVLLRLRSGI